MIDLIKLDKFTSQFNLVHSSLTDKTLKGKPGYKRELVHISTCWTNQSDLFLKQRIGTIRNIVNFVPISSQRL